MTLRGARQEVRCAAAAVAVVVTERAWALRLAAGAAAHSKVVVALAAAGVVLAVLVSTDTTSMLYVTYLAVSLAFGTVCWTTLVWMLHAWRSPAAVSENHLPHDDAVQPAHSFSLIVPARHEESVLEATLSRLVTTEHPAFEVLVVVGSDDPGTRAVAERVAARHPHLVRVVVDAGVPKNKPRALNAALPHCAGAVTGVFDAEDDVHPGLLRRVDQCFQQSGADVVQAGVQLMNFRSSWLTVRNVLEYFFWFRSRLHFHAGQGFIPLGGNTVFVRTDVLRAVDGWDAECLAEDCELGVRLSSLGARTVVFYEPELVTREECPPTLVAFARQRTRWNQGYLQTLAKGYWRRLPRRQRVLGFYILAMPYLLALAWLLIPIAVVTAIVVSAPVPLSLISFLPVLPMLSILAVEVAGLGDFCRAYGERASARDYLRLVAGLPVYQAVLAYAAARAVAREALGARGWEKTAHHGLHLAAAPERAATLIGAEARALPAAAAAGGTAAVAVAGGPTGARARTAPSFRVLPTDGGGPPARRSGSRRRRSGGRARDARPARRPLEDLFGVTGREPLWVRLHDVSADGSAAPAPPGFRLAAAGRAADLHALLRRALAGHVDVALMAWLLVLVGFVQGTNMLHWPAALFDEGTYIGNAWSVQHGALAPYTYGYGHPPLAWLLIFLWTWTGGLLGNGAYSIDAGRQLMLVVTLVECALLYTLARRIRLGRAAAAGAVVLFALSPLSLFFHRAVLLDNPASLFSVAAFALALTPQRRMWAFAGAGACFAASVLCKETTLVLLPALVLAATHNADRLNRRYCLTLLGAFFVVIGTVYPLYATLKGELLPGAGHVSLVGEMVVQLFTRQATGSVFDAQSTTHATLASWLALDPWLLGAAVAFAPVALLRRATRAVALAYVIQVVMVLRPGYLPGMYVIGLLPFAALTVAAAIEALWGVHAGAGHEPGRRGMRSRRLTAWGARWLVPVALGAIGFVAVQVVGVRWAHGAKVAITARPDAPAREAQRWLVRHVDHRRRVIVDDEFWIYLVNHGYDAHPIPGGFFSRTIVSYWPLDYDPAVAKRFPGGWRDFDYIVATEPMRSTRDRVPKTVQALTHSRVIVTFGSGARRIEIRAIDRGRPS